MASDDWRGSPTATKRYEFIKLLKVIKPKKSDVYYDLGCGYGNTCRWISTKVKKAIGIESKPFRYRKAIKLTHKSRYPNVEFMKRNFFNIELNDATIIYCTQELSISDYAKLQKKINKRTRIIVPELPPPYPIKSKRVWPFFIFRTPVKRAKNENEYATIYFGEKAAMEEMLNELPRDVAKGLKFQISRSESNWKKLDRP